MTEIRLQIYREFIDELSLAGVTEAVICPGSRSTPLAIWPRVIRTSMFISMWMKDPLLFAMGMAKAMRKPVALICTSGTAAANFYPAVIEAHYSRIPLMILTADRPHELREVGAPQAIDQQFLFGNFVKFSQTRLCLTVILTCWRTSGLWQHVQPEKPKSAARPVHINFPLREPLMPNLEDEPFKG
ncbi:thiamine pyrophosphate-binding protein [Bacillus licheniformis]|nr:thiamine pyrophosphate-binding protein [Bacillus licheniformis]